MSEARKTGVRRKAAPKPAVRTEPETAEPAGGDQDAAADPTDLAAVRALAAKQGAAAMAALAQIMAHGSSEASRIAAANALLDRAYGKGRIGGEAAEPPPIETRVTVRFV